MLRKINKQSFSPVAILRYCLLFLAVLFFSPSTHVFGHSVEQENENSAKIASFYHGDFFISSDFNSKNQIPSDSTPEEPENSAEADDENNEEDYRLLYRINYSDYTFRISSFIRNHFYQSVQSYQNQSSLPLYLLFHSWKSYLL